MVYKRDCDDIKRVAEIALGAAEAEERFDDAVEIIASAMRSVRNSDVALLVAAKGLKRIVEEIDGTIKHGTWKDNNGARLKDTPEWVSFYSAIFAAVGEPV